jgi:hypothetical protein
MRGRADSGSPLSTGGATPGWRVTSVREGVAGLVDRPRKKAVTTAQTMSRTSSSPFFMEVPPSWQLYP